ncbi:MAG: hypothetical protein HRT77_17825 [Halioglobus sp.]|nr:hypothetical protein [Halioglobus sp.]
MYREAQISCIATALAVMVVGCGTTLGVRPAIEAAAKQFEPVPGKARIYVLIYPVGDAAVGTYTISVAGYEAPRVADKGFAMFDVEPGVHIVQRGTGRKAVGTQIVTEAGKVYFVNAFAKTGVWGVSMTVVPPDIGMEIVRDSTMAWSTQQPDSEREMSAD